MEDSASPDYPALRSWLEIARHLGRSLRTVQRWAALYDMPVHRPHGKSHAVVTAYPDELDRWLKRHQPVVLSTQEKAKTAPPPTPDGTDTPARRQTAPILPETLQRLMRNVEQLKTLRRQMSSHSLQARAGVAKARALRQQAGALSTSPVKSAGEI
jgi:hypothetical protein